VQSEAEEDSVMGWAPGAKERAVTRRQVILEAMVEGSRGVRRQRFCRRARGACDG
jgi:hypothetical protein